MNILRLVANNSHFFLIDNSKKYLPISNEDLCISVLRKSDQYRSRRAASLCTVLCSHGCQVDLPFGNQKYPEFQTTCPAILRPVASGNCGWIKYENALGVTGNKCSVNIANDPHQGSFLVGLRSSR